MNNQSNPVIFYENTYVHFEILNFIENNNLIIADLYESQVNELAQITSNFRSNKVKHNEYIKSQRDAALVDKNNKGDWIYFPWTNVILHQVKKENFLTILTDRNIGFVSKKEQKNFLQKKICIVGLSTGGSIALGLVHSGIGAHFTLSDFDYIDTSDLNRTFYDLSDVGLRKVTALSRKMYQINPYLDINVYSEGFLQSNATEILNSQKFDVFFDVASQLTPGLLIRQFAKRNKLPVISCGNIGYGAYIALERYDINTNQELYFGIQNDELKEYLETNDYEGLENSTLDLISVNKIEKKTLKIIKNKNYKYTETPQLFSALSFNSSVIPFFLKRIFNGKKTKKEYFFKHSF